MPGNARRRRQRRSQPRPGLPTWIPTGTTEREEELDAAAPPRNLHLPSLIQRREGNYASGRETEERVRRLTETIGTLGRRRAFPVRYLNTEEADEPERGEDTCERRQTNGRGWATFSRLLLAAVILVAAFKGARASQGPELDQLQQTAKDYESFTKHIAKLQYTEAPVKEWEGQRLVPHQDMLRKLENWGQEDTWWKGIPKIRESSNAEKEEKWKTFREQKQIETIRFPTKEIGIQQTGPKDHNDQSTKGKMKYTPMHERSKRDTGKRSTAVARDARKLRGYDCSEPSNITTVNLRNEVDLIACDRKSLQKQQEKKKYVLLQESQRVHTKVKHCIGRFSRIVYICATQSHVELAPSEFKYDEIYHFDAETCQKMWDDKGYEFPFYKEIGGRKSMWQHTTPNAISHMVLPRVGAYWSSVSGIECKGDRIESWDLKHIAFGAPEPYLDSAIMVDFLNLEMFEQDAYIITSPAGRKQLHVPKKNLILDCDYSERSCDAGKDGTFIWETMAEEDPRMCPFFKMKEVAGVQLKAAEEEMKGDGLLEVARNHLEKEKPNTQAMHEDAEMFVATNGTMLRVKRVGPPISKCNGVVYATEYPHIYLTEDFEHPQFNRPIDPAEVNFAIMTVMGDHFVHGQLQDDLARSILSLQIEQCEQKREKAKRDYAQRLARQKAVADGDTAHVGDGTFITASGDAAHIYHCRPVIVRATVREDQRCYSALPVELTDPEDIDYFSRLAESQGTVYVSNGAVNATVGDDTVLRFFLEPRSHRLVMMAVPVECVPQMAALFENLQGDWLAHYGNAIHIAPTPVDPRTEIQTTFWNYERSSLPSPETAMPYEWPTIHAFCRFLTDPTAAQSLSLEMIRGIKTVVSHSGEAVQDVFHRANIGDFVAKIASNTFSAAILELSGLLNFWKAWGGLIQHAFFAYMSLLFLFYCLRVMSRLCMPKEGKGALGHLFYAFDPDLYRLCCKKSYKRFGAHGPSHALVEALAGLMAERGFVLSGYQQQTNDEETRRLGDPPPSDSDDDDQGPPPGTGAVRRNARGRNDNNVNVGRAGSLCRTNSTTTCATELNMVTAASTLTGHPRELANPPTPLDIQPYHSELLPMPPYPTFSGNSNGVNVVRMQEPRAAIGAVLPTLRLQRPATAPADEGDHGAAAAATPPGPQMPRVPPNSVARLPTTNE
jgi:hypothetical protein